MCSYVDIQHEIDKVVKNFFAELGNLESDRADRTVIQLYLELLDLPLSMSEIELSDHLREMPVDDLVAFMEEQCFDAGDLRKAISACPHNSGNDDSNDDSHSDNASVVVHDEVNDDDEAVNVTASELPDAPPSVLPNGEPAMTVTESYLKNCSIM